MNQTIFRQGYDVTHPDYLEANRAGSIHPDQAAILPHPLARLFGWVQTRGPSSFLRIPILVFFLLIFGLCALWNADILPLEYIIGAGLLLPVIVGMIVAYTVYRSWRRRTTIKRELEQDLVEDGIGEVTFGRRGYEIKLRDRRLQLPFTGLGTLSPGVEYHFYYLPQSGTVLSAQQLTPSGAQRAKESLTEVLARANRFKLEALNQNRQGMLAGSQIIHLLPGVLFALLFAVVTFGGLAYILMPYVTGQNESGPDVGVVIMAAFLGIIGIVAVYLLVKSLRDVIGGRVLSVEGPGHVYTRTSSDSDGGRTTRYYYQIGGQRFLVTRKAYRALIQNLTYRAYYTPHRKTLVNIEVLEPGRR